MKFGKRMRCLISIEWENGYVDYKGLKKYIKKMNGNEIERNIEFQNLLLRELSKVNTFFFLILDELNKEENLILLNNNNIKYQFLSILKLSNRIDTLRRYIVLNYLAIIKISKKFNKTINHIKNNIMNDLLLQPFYAGNYLDQLYSKTSNLLDSILNLLVPDLNFTIEDSSCPICLYPFNSPVTLSCMHTFCWSCLAKASEHHIHACPLCRQIQSIDPRDYEIDGLIKRFLKMYSMELNRGIKSPNYEIIQQGIQLATKFINEIQYKYTLALSSLPPDSDSDGENGSITSNTSSTCKILLPRVASIAYVSNRESLENTIHSGAHMVALDIHLCHSGDLVVHTDAILNGQFLVDMNLDTLNQLGILTLSNVFTILRRQIAVYIHIVTDDVIEPLIQLLKILCNDQKINGWNSAMFYIASGNHYQLLALNGYRTSIATLSGIHTVVTTSSIPLGYCKNFENLHVTHVCIDMHVITKPFVYDAHSRGIQIFVGIVNHENIVWKMLEEMEKIDGMLSHYPEMLSNTLRHHALNHEKKNNELNNKINNLLFKPGDPIEILYNEKWYNGVILEITNKKPLKYSVLWWMNDNSQRRSKKVDINHLRSPLKSIILKMELILHLVHSKQLLNGQHQQFHK